ncbi:hypothetical protein [Streptomyces syringium]|uniref:hypothetical protein n=1 Tax=Streptomyces syringium TaxID=76729 RepID=UPI0033CC013A
MTMTFTSATAAHQGQWTTPPRWAVHTAKAAALTTVPSGLWRVAAALGIPVGFSGDNPMADVGFGSGFSLYMIALSVFAECLGLLSLGLVQRWGEVFPRWFPFIGGRRVPVSFAVTSAGLGSLALMYLTVSGALNWNTPDTMGGPEAPKGTAALVMGACYAPLLLWGPLLAVVTVAYAVRRRPRT